MAIRDEVRRANEDYVARFDKGDLAMPPSRRFAVVTCMDARLDPAGFLGLEEGDAHVIRNAGGLVTDDALRSLAISHWLLGTQEALVIGHTDCGMLTFTNDELHARLRDQGIDASAVDFHPFADLEQSVRASVDRIRQSPLLPDQFGASGYIYEVRTGELLAVAGAQTAAPH
jgi:carbonic anhydrase